MPFSVFIPCKYLSADFVISNAKFFHFSRKATAVQSACHAFFLPAAGFRKNIISQHRPRLSANPS
jgi:hypothetical protein|nr:MAG TPA: hypothetical protein [Caudoviricetes sp.]